MRKKTRRDSKNQTLTCNKVIERSSQASHKFELANLCFHHNEKCRTFVRRNSPAALEDIVKLPKIASTFFACLLFVTHSTAQQGQSSQSGNPSTQNQPRIAFPAPPDPNAGGNNDAAQQRMAGEMAKKANLARQAALKSDTDRLLKLAEELKTSVDKSSANVLSLDVIKKAEEIEKLAHSVKDKMKGPT
jgi:hypothetical protein